MADLDTLAIARSATAPLTPHGDGDSLMRRMLAITPAGPRSTGENQTDAGTATNLPTLLDLYGGDAAKAWAALKIGADALDALVAKHGAGWFAALPAEARTAVAADMAMLNAVSSQRSAPAPAERGELAMAIADQPWSDERKQHAFDELNTRIALEARRDKEAQDDATEKGLAVAEQLSDRFISINQLPPAVREHLPPDALAALMLRADRNVHPVTVPAHGDVAMRLNRMAASDPEAFAREDLRLHRDEMTPAEYDALSRVQEGVGTYPPAHAAMTQLRAMETIQRNGLDGSATGTGVINQPEAAPEQSPQTDEEGNAAGTERTAQLMPIAYGKAKSRRAQAKQTTAPDKAPAWVKKQQESIWRSPIYLSSSRDEDAYKAVRRMGNPDGWTIIYTHGDPHQDGKVFDRFRGEPDLEMSAKEIYTDLIRKKNYDPKATILLTACYGANDITARDLSKLTHGVVYVAKGYVSEPSVEKNIYRLTVNNQFGKRTGYAKFVDGVEVPSTLLSLSYDRETHSWKFGVLKKPAPVGDRSPSPGKESWIWRLFHPH